MNETVRFIDEAHGSALAAKAVMDRIGEQFQTPILRHRGIELTVEQAVDVRRHTHDVLSAIAKLRDTLDQTREGVGG